MNKFSRRQFLYSTALILSAPASSLALWSSDEKKGVLPGPDNIRGKIFKGDAPDKPGKWSKEGFLYTKLSNKNIICGICPHRCQLSPGDRSVCRSKVNIDGTLYSLSYGNPCTVNVDPIEKTAFPFQTPDKIIFACSGRMQFPLSKLSELGNITSQTR